MNVPDPRDRDDETWMLPGGSVKPGETLDEAFAVLDFRREPIG